MLFQFTFKQNYVEQLRKRVDDDRIKLEQEAALKIQVGCSFYDIYTIIPNQVWWRDLINRKRILSTQQLPDNITFNGIGIDLTSTKQLGSEICNGSHSLDSSNNEIMQSAAIKIQV